MSTLTGLTFASFANFALFREKSKIGHSRKFISWNYATFPIRESLSIKIATFFPTFRFLASPVNFHENPLFLQKKNLKIFEQFLHSRKFISRKFINIIIRESLYSRNFATTRIRESLYATFR